MITGNKAVAGLLRFKDPTLYVVGINTASTRDLGLVRVAMTLTLVDFLMGFVYEVDNTAGGKS